MSRHSKAQGHHPMGSRVHGAGVLREERHDAYRPIEKHKDGTTCPDCHAQVRRGAWRWVAAADVREVAAPEGPTQRCPACQRLQAHDPAAIITLDGDYAALHVEPLRALIRHEAQRQVAEHPLERIMEVQGLPGGGLIVTTTGPHLARAIGHALERAHKGSLAVQYLKGQTLARVHWHRD